MKWKGIFEMINSMLNFNIEEHDMDYIETSALDTTNVEEAFLNIIRGK